MSKSIKILIFISVVLLILNISKLHLKKDIDVKIEKEIPKAFIIPNPNLKIDKSKKREIIESVVSDKTIYLTFDDGPSHLTDKILNILNEENVPATFFIIGSHIEEYKNTIFNAYNSGHCIANHTYSHKYDYIYKEDKNFYDDFNKMNSIIYDITGHNTHILRFPGGSSNLVSKKYNKGIVSRIADTFNQNNYYYFDWNVDSGDASGSLDKMTITQNVISNLKPGTNIVLMHDAGHKKTTVEALPHIIKYGKNNGYTFAKITKNTPAIRHSINN